MSTHGGRRDVPPGDKPGWDPDGEDARRRRLVQMREVVDAFAEVGVPIGIGPDDGSPDAAEFLYAKGAVLARDGDVGRVRSVLGLDGDQPPKDIGQDQRRTPTRGRDRASGSAGLTRIELPGDRDTLRTVDELDRVLGPGVATPDHVVHLTPKSYACPATEPVPAKDPLDPSPTQDTGLGRGVRVVVVDTGLVTTLAAATPWLAGVTGDEEQQAAVGRYRGHGTFIAGVVRSMAPAAQIDVEAFLWVGGGILESDLVPALRRSLESMPDIISMSAGATTRHGHPLMSMEVFWRTHLRHVKGTVLVCAAGNNGDRGPFWPATFPWSVSVGALDADGGRADYSNFGSWVDVWARGSDVVNAYPDGDYTYGWPADPPRPQPGDTVTFETGLASWSGTSFSTPLVAGLVAARMSWSGESARDAATALLRASVRGATPGVGAVLAPGMADPP
ncbi:MAG: S8/S53 family peptidase [Actinomycetota bacterium]|nr:S8/S53 family peptidase [Actinomycetota bacterium]